MRDIKFRAWNPKTKTMVYDPIVKIDSINSAFRISVFEFMQYTGLKDKNEKEIYEGDIVERIAKGDEISTITTYFIGQVIFGGGSFMFLGKVQRKDESDIPDKFILNTRVDWNVIGNIWENPELLK